MARILVASPWQYLTRIVRSDLRTTATPVEVVECLPDEAPCAVGQTIGRERGAVVVVAPPLTASVLRRHVRVPVVVLDVDRAEIWRAVAALRPCPREVACVLFGGPPPRYTGDDLNAAAVTGCAVVPFYLEGLDGVPVLLEALRDRGVGALVTTCHTVAWSAREMGFAAALVRLHRRALERAVDSAELYLALEEERRRGARRLAAALDACPAPAVFVGRGGRVLAANRAAEEALGADGRGEGAGCHLVSVDTRGRVSAGGGRVSLRRTVPVEGDPLGEEKVLVLAEAGRGGAKGNGFVPRYTFEDILGVSAPIRAALARARVFARSDSPLLIEGETGTGKELFAHAVHAAGPRWAGPFVAVNCRALPESLLESELFGYEPGTFTGGRREGKPGLFELAHGGTLFLDEIGDLSPSSQAALLRVLDHGYVRRVGGTGLVRVDVRVVAATNVDLAAAVEAGRYRRDLYYRLSCLVLRLAPLRERLEDIPVLAEAFLRENGDRYGRGFPAFGAEALALMMAHPWPGNVRELRSFVERYCLAMMEEEREPAAVVRSLLGQGAAEGVPCGGEGLLRRVEREIIEQLLRDRTYRKKDLARILGVSRTTLWKRQKELEGGGAPCGRGPARGEGGGTFTVR